MGLWFGGWFRVFVLRPLRETRGGGFYSKNWFGVTRDSGRNGLRCFQGSGFMVLIFQGIRFVSLVGIYWYIWYLRGIWKVSLVLRSYGIWGIFGRSFVVYDCIFYILVYLDGTGRYGNTLVKKLTVIVYVRYTPRG